MSSFSILSRAITAFIAVDSVSSNYSNLGDSLHLFLYCTDRSDVFGVRPTCALILCCQLLLQGSTTTLPGINTYPLDIKGILNKYSRWPRTNGSTTKVLSQHKETLLTFDKTSKPQRQHHLHPAHGSGQQIVAKCHHEVVRT